ncbi:alpha/beta fold hydrolase [Propioniciclava flava]|uniref:Alpha/beta hydrolase n=1 Tax=Propioniciclava flava TaxID=2072026 RepID=A0A4Q2EMM1_9ACTN|nr:alpha/beta fold hydrolase [Propioniciclava flava]RXW33315.1 alpha/beta hydrolase [Propioniciclava flava]
MALHTMRIGSGVPRVAYLHGLLGQGKNLATIAKAVSATDPGVLIDLPNHGRSPWTSTFGYADWADDVAAELRALLPPGVPITVFGHSMGGKTAMALALRHPTLVRALVVADIAPDDSSHGYGFARLVNGLRTLPLDQVSTREDADALLAPTVPDPGVRAFLLQNLHRAKPEGWRWLPHLDLLARSLPLISGWPAGLRGPYLGPVLWLRGGESGYVTDDHVPAMRALFPRTRLVTIKGAGHWLHADQPDAVAATLQAFLDTLRPQLGR